jgi:alpha-glucoside transport system substrate-binding protein
MSKYRFHILALLALGATLAAAAVASGRDSTPTSTEQRRQISGTVSIISEATPAEQENFRAVLNGFERQYPRVNVRYTNAGRNISTILSTAVAGGNPPHVALLPQPGLMRDFIRRRALRPLNFVRSTVARRWSRGWLELATVNRNLYAVFFKGANKSTIWYNVGLFRRAGVRPPTTFSGLLRAARTLRASGTRAYSIGGASGWTLTDLFENIYLRQAGPRLYDRLSNHRIRWTHPSVKAALRTMARIVGDTNNIPGGRQGALQTDFDESVTQAFSDNPRAAMVIEADFVAGVITGSTNARPGRDFNFFAFPSINRRWRNAVVGGGDAVVMFRDTPAARALIRYFTTPQAAQIWARRGGFSSPNKLVRPSAYSNAITRRTAVALARAQIFRFDLSDLQPSAFGATVGQGLFKLFQDFLENPRNVNGITSQMERAAAAAYRR